MKTCNQDCKCFEYVMNNIGHCKEAEMDVDNPTDGIVIMGQECEKGR